MYCVLENCKKDGRHLWCFYHHSPFDIDTVASHPRSVLFDPKLLSILGSLIAFARLFEERLHTGWHQKEREKAPLLAISILLEADDGALGNGGTNDLTIEPSSIVSKLITVTWKDTVVARPARRRHYMQQRAEKQLT